MVINNNYNFNNIKCSDFLLFVLKVMENFVFNINVTDNYGFLIKIIFFNRYIYRCIYIHMFILFISLVTYCFLKHTKFLNAR